MSENYLPTSVESSLDVFSRMYQEHENFLRPPTEDDDKTRAWLEDEWERWVPKMFPKYLASKKTGEELPFAEHQKKLWDHAWSIEPGERPETYVAIWGRGLTKSTTAEMICVALGARKKKRYVLYVCGTQEQADDHVGNVGEMLGEPNVERYYPELARRDVNKFGTSKGWRRNRLRTAAGFTIDAIGLDVARTRGAKLEDVRPDLIIFDDLDDQEDTEETVAKKIRALVRKILPAGSDDLAIIGIQNLVHEGSIFSKLGDGSAKFLSRRVVSGPIDVVEDIKYDEAMYERTGYLRILGGKPAWAGIDMQRAQQIADDEGGEAFLVERCNKVEILGGRIYRPEFWRSDRRWYVVGDPMHDPMYEAEDEVIGRYAFADTAYKDKDSTSDTSFVAFELMASWRVRLCYLWKGKVEFPALLSTVTETAEYLNHDGALSGFVIEDKATGISALQTLYLAADEWLADILDSFDPGTASKDERDRLAAPYCRAGGVLMPYPHPSIPELQDFLDNELYKAKPSKRDRRDAFTMGILYLERFLAQWHKAEMKRLAGMRRLVDDPILD